MSEVLEVSPREKRGTLNNRRLRLSGQLPAILYGHGKESVSLSIPTEQMETTLRHGTKVVDLKGAADGQALLQEIQWDTFQQHVLHVDLLRVDAHDRIKVIVSIVLRGEAPGQNEGGIIEQLLREVEVETSPANVPDILHVSLRELQIGDSVKVSDIEDLPEGCTILHDTNATVAQCVEPIAELEEEETIEGGIEPEVIGQKDEEESAG